MRVDRIEAWACSFPLPAPFEIGAMRIDRRDYTVVRVTAEDGTQGVAYSLSRGAPTDLAVTGLVAPIVLGRDARGTAGAVAECERRLVALGTEGIVGRALSLVDICLWDVKARLERLPLWRVLGDRDAGKAPVLLVEGYPKAGESHEEFGERLAARAREGFSALKIANVTDPAFMSERLAATRAAVGRDVEIVVDVAWAWPHAATAIEIARSWERFGLAWIEDPFPPYRAAEIAALRDEVHTPIAAGDELANRWLLSGLVDAVDLLRLDATTIGGISGFLSAHAAARRADLRVATHIHPEIHQHLTFGLEAVGPVETYPRPSDFDAAHRFVLPASLELVDGAVRPPEAPGLGLELDWEAVEAHAARHSVAP